MAAASPAHHDPVHADGCELCRSGGGPSVWHDESWRVVRVEDAGFPAFYRVVCNRHVAEFTDLTPQERCRCMTLVAAVEQVLRDALQPTKINLASLGNVVPHVHWHVIARFSWDSHFPQPIWAAPIRLVEAPPALRLPLTLVALDQRVGTVIAQLDATTPD